jgi:hypothetical protein
MSEGLHAAKYACNRAAVYLETRDFDSCLRDCDLVIGILKGGREDEGEAGCNDADTQEHMKLAGKALARCQIYVYMDV